MSQHNAPSGTLHHRLRTLDCPVFVQYNGCSCNLHCHAVQANMHLQELSLTKTCSVLTASLLRRCPNARCSFVRPTSAAHQLGPPDCTSTRSAT